MRRRSNLLVLLGLASFVLGLVAVYLITGDDDGGGGANSVPVLVADGDLANGSLGDNLIAEGQVRVIEVDAGDRAPDALVSQSQLSGTRLVATFTDGEQLRAAGVQSLGGARAEIPEDFEAVALQVEFVAGGANTIIPNDRVNIFLQQTEGGAIATNDDGTIALTGNSEQVKLLLTNVLVLDVQQGTPNLAISSATDPTAVGDSPEFLIVVVAVDTVDAEKLIFASVTSQADQYRGIYLSRVRIDDEGNPSPPAVGNPDGRNLENILAEEAAVAFERSNG